MTVNVYEFGFQPSLQVRYQVTPEFNVTFMPLAMDMNFWRHATANAGGQSVSGSSSDFGVTYQVLMSAGFNF